MRYLTPPPPPQGRARNTRRAAALLALTLLGWLAFGAVSANHQSDSNGDNRVHPPTGLTLGTPTSDSIPISWTAPSPIDDVETYFIQWREGTDTSDWVSNPGTEQSKTQPVADGVSATVTGLSPSTNYVIRVQSRTTVSGRGNSWYSTPQAFTTTAVDPNAPLVQNLRATSVTTNQVVVSWNQITSPGDKTRFRFHRRGPTDTIWIAAGTNFNISTTTHTFGSLSQNTEYQFRVTPCAGASCVFSDASIITVTTLGNPTATIVGTTTFNEANLHGAQITIELAHTTYATSPDQGDFSFQPSESGLDFSGITRNSNTRATLRVTFTGDLTSDVAKSIRIGPGSTAHTGIITTTNQVTLRAASTTTPPPDPETPNPGTTTTTAAAQVKLIYRSDRTDIAESGPTEFWFPVRGRDCDPPDPSRCGWLSLPDDLREQMNNTWNPVSELATDVYTALDPSPDSVPSGGPSGAVKVQLWAVFPHPERGMNSVSLVAGPYDTPFTVCWPSPSSNRVLQRYDRATSTWVELQPVIAEQDGHICAETHDLGYIGTAAP